MENRFGEASAGMQAGGFSGKGLADMKPTYKRILLKLSGEAMAGEAKTGLDFDTVLKVWRRSEGMR